MRVFQLLILRCGPGVALRGGGKEGRRLTVWLTGCWSLLSLSLSWQFLCHLNCCCRLSSLICWLHLAVFFVLLPLAAARLPPPPLLYTAFRFLFGRFQHLPAPFWCPLKRMPSEQLLLLLLLAACCLLSVFFFLLARKMIPTYNCFCCTPHARTVAAPSLCTPISPSSSLALLVRPIPATLKSFVRIYANERQFLPFVCNDVAATKRGQQGQQGQQGRQGGGNRNCATTAKAGRKDVAIHKR